MYGRRKYGNKKITTMDGEVFDSRLEMLRWEVLKQAEKDGQIFNLKRQVPFVLIEEQSYRIRKKLKTKFKFEERKERPTVYLADFTYEKVIHGLNIREIPHDVTIAEYVGLVGHTLSWTGLDNAEATIQVIEDTKGVKTKDYVIKRKLMRLAGNPIREVKMAGEEI